MSKFEQKEAITVAGTDSSGGSGLGGMIDPREVWRRVATRGDLATVLIAAPIGFVGDVALSLGGLLSPGTCAALTASAALGIKNAIQASFREKVPRIPELPSTAQPVSVEAKAQNLILLLRSQSTLLVDKEKMAKRLEQELGLFKLGLLDEKKLTDVIDEGVAIIREPKFIAFGPEQGRQTTIDREASTGVPEAS